MNTFQRTNDNYSKTSRTCLLYDDEIIENKNSFEFNYQSVDGEWTSLDVDLKCTSFFETSSQSLSSTINYSTSRIKEIPKPTTQTTTQTAKQTTTQSTKETTKEQTSTESKSTTAMIVETTSEKLELTTMNINSTIIVETTSRISELTTENNFVAIYFNFTLFLFLYYEL